MSKVDKWITFMLVKLTIIPTYDFGPREPYLVPFLKLDSAFHHANLSR